MIHAAIVSYEVGSIDNPKIEREFALDSLATHIAEGRRILHDHSMSGVSVYSTPHSHIWLTKHGLSTRVLVVLKSGEQLRSAVAALAPDITLDKPTAELIVRVCQTNRSAQLSAETPRVINALEQGKITLDEHKVFLSQVLLLEASNTGVMQPQYQRVLNKLSELDRSMPTEDLRYKLPWLIATDNLSAHRQQGQAARQRWSHYENAFWNGTEMVYGPDDLDLFRSFTEQVDTP